MSKSLGDWAVGPTSDWNCFRRYGSACIFSLELEDGHGRGRGPVQGAAEANRRLAWHARSRDVSRSKQTEIHKFLIPPSSSGRHPSRSHLSPQRRVFFSAFIQCDHHREKGGGHISPACSRKVPVEYIENYKPPTA